MTIYMSSDTSPVSQRGKKKSLLIQQEDEKAGRRRPASGFCCFYNCIAAYYLLLHYHCLNSHTVPIAATMYRFDAPVLLFPFVGFFLCGLVASGVSLVAIRSYYGLAHQS